MNFFLLGVQVSAEKDQGACERVRRRKTLARFKKLRRGGQQAALSGSSQNLALPRELALSGLGSAALSSSKVALVRWRGTQLEACLDSVEFQLATHSAAPQVRKRRKAQPPPAARSSRRKPLFGDPGLSPRDSRLS